MNQNELQNNPELNDLTVNAEIKGGPNPKTKRTIVLQSSATGGDLADLEPQGDVVGGISLLLPAVQKVR
ncbi:MAG TPA: hypothetical protein PLD20_11985 [Blastocatellia bacterium]|nr:hypothetical protein [Blastocatellia bacterium]HMV86191.1 hypothetical protein [Blastocatellia bacterium]HMX28065.1 hypothetical protein [Blastocatellia bacterium]HMY70972.1 hypothetical protein [Blastocatellia bacterium]HMZ18645.1 hypothetical protein [Blastocatellia bacterium]